MNLKQIKQIQKKFFFVVIFYFSFIFVELKNKNKNFLNFNFKFLIYNLKLNQHIRINETTRNNTKSIYIKQHTTTKKERKVKIQ